MLRDTAPPLKIFRFKLRLQCAILTTMTKTACEEVLYTGLSTDVVFHHPDL
jgi:hypothetical protein